MHIPHLRYIGFLIYPIWGILYFAYTPFFTSKTYPVLNYYFICIYILYRKKNIPRLRYIFNNRKKICPKRGIKEKQNIPQTGYICASITMMRNFWRIMVSYFLSRKITHHGCRQFKRPSCKILVDPTTC